MSAGATARVVRLAPAKLNLTLAVTGRRPDGFHALHSIVAPLSFGDQIGVEVAPEATEDTLLIAGSDDLSAGPDNLVLRAILATRRALVSARFGAPLAPLEVRLVKRVPVAAGLGGGSGDAAATIAAALEAWHGSLPAQVAADVAASLGSDVPFFLAGGPALVTGRGEHVDPLPPFRGEAPAVLLVTPRLPVPTPAVFAAFAAGTRPSAGESATTLAASERLAMDMRAGMTAGTLLERAVELAAANDLLPGALSVAPPLGPFRDALTQLLGRPVGLSGSGPTCWILYPDAASAEAAAAAVRQAAARGDLPLSASGEPFVAASAIGARTAHNEPATQEDR
jgi:4-diphosphocytidyl-2-C-methyl-D-erythritol kinase